MSDSLPNTASYQAALVNDPLIVKPTATLVEVVQLMNQARMRCELEPTVDSIPKVLAEARSSCVLVIDGAGTLQGIVTERDLVRLGVERDDWQTAIAGEVMTHPVLALPLAQLTDMFVVLEQFRLHRIRHLPVLDEGGQVAGLITQASLRLVTRPIDLMRFQTVADAMTDQVITASPQTNLLEINHLLVQNRISCVVVVEAHERLAGKVRPVGIITERDLVQLRSLHLNFADCQVQQAMVQPVVTVNGQDTLLEVQNLMETHQIHQVVVEGDGGELLGLVTPTNVLGALNPWELFRLTETLEKRISLLESEKIALLESRALDLEREVQARTRSLEEKHQQEKLVNRIANQIRSSLALPKILQATVTQIRELFNCDRVAVWQCDDQGVLTAIAEAKSDQVLSQLKERVDDPCFREKGLGHYVNGKTWVVNDFCNETMTDCYRALMARLQIRAKILVAIIIEGRLWGLLEASESQCARHWSDYEINLIQSLATQLAIAIDQAQTHQSLENLTQDLEKRVAQRTASLETALAELRSEVLRRTEVESRQALLLSELSDFKFALDQAAIVAITDTDGKITYCNDKLCEISGYSREELIGQTHRVIKSNHHSRGFYQQLWDTITRGNIWKGEICNCTKDGRDYWVDTTIVPFCDPQGIPVQYLAIRIDITPRKLAEQVVTQQLACIEAAIDGIAILKDEKYIYLNESHVTLFGYDDLQQLLGQSWRLLYAPEELQRFETDIFPQLLRDKHWQGEATATRRDGSTFSEGLSLTLAEDGGLICVCRDISAQKEAEDALLRTTTELNQFFSLALDLLCIANTDGYFLRLNQEWEKTLGYSLEELKSRPLLDFIHPDDLEQTLAAIAKLSTGSEIIGFTNRFRCKDGSFRWLEWRGAPSGKVIYSAARDITDRKRNEETLTLTNQELERATRLKDEFLANMSHELRTPLNAILGLTDGLKEGVFGETNEKQQKALNTIHTSSDHLLTLINDILDLSKIEAGKITLEPNPTAIANLCKISLDFVKQLAYQKRLELTLQVPDNLPELTLDERRIRQVLINLLSNAVKFTPEGGKVDLVVTFHAAPPAAGSPDPSRPSAAYFIHFAVVDTGIGISPENLSKLFQPFIQIDSALNRQHAGTGLGLALVKRIVELHGGQMEVSSQMGQGSRFGFVLPCPEIVASLPSLFLPSTGSDSGPGGNLPAAIPTESVLILLVEDNEANIQTFSSYLEAKQYRVTIAKDGITAVEKAGALTPDIILMDIQLPELDGISAIQRIRALPALAKTPIIALTALAMKGDQEKCLAAGANEYLSKPIRLQHLAQTIQRLLISAKSP